MIRRHVHVMQMLEYVGLAFHSLLHAYFPDTLLRHMSCACIFALLYRVGCAQGHSGRALVRYDRVIEALQVFLF